MKSLFRTYKIRIVMLCFGLTGVSFLFLNFSIAKYRNLSPEELKTSIASFDQFLSANQLGDKGKKIILENKKVVVRYFALKMKITSCAELLREIPRMDSGIYEFALNGDSKPSRQYFCGVKNGVLANAVDLGERKIASCATDGTCQTHRDFFASVDCEAKGQARVYCPVERVYGEPNLVSKFAGDCNPGDFGFEIGRGLWVSNGCGGRFELNKVPSRDLQQIANVNLKNQNVDVSTSTINWRYLGEKYEYSIDAQILENGAPITIEDCLDSQTFDNTSRKKKQKFEWTRVCQNGQVVPLTSESKIRICALRDGRGRKKQIERCSDYVSVDTQISLKF